MWRTSRSLHSALSGVRRARPRVAWRPPDAYALSLAACAHSVPLPPAPPLLPTHCVAQPCAALLPLCARGLRTTSSGSVPSSQSESVVTSAAAVAAAAAASVSLDGVSDEPPGPDDIEEPDASRLARQHELENAPGSTPPGALIQGLTSDALSAAAAPPFTLAEMAALVHDLHALGERLRSESGGAGMKLESGAPGSPQSPATPATPPTPATPAAASASIAPSASDTLPPASSFSTLPTGRPFLASWSVKEVCSWLLEVHDEIGLSSAGVKAYIDLLQNHAIDGARLLAFTTEPALIPLIPPQLLSKILLLRGLDTYSHMFQPHASASDDSSHADPNMRHLQAMLHSTVKIFCTSTAPDFARPWSQQDQVESTSSGFVIAGRRILGNAHGATHATNIRVRKHGDATKYKARVLTISHESDLVLLEVDNDKFWTGLEPLPFGHVPRLQDTVVVVGYPTGGDSVCVTKGVVSRILVSNYVHSDESLLTIQIDAAINSGNSGGPVLLNGSVVGVAFQGVAGAQSVGYIIPIPVVQHFLHDLRLHRGRYTGFPSFAGLTFQKLENESLKRSLGMKEEETGILVMDRAPLDGSFHALRNNDVLTHVDGIPVADDGSIHFRAGERISVRYLPSSKFVGDQVRMRVVREGKAMDVSYTLQARRNLVPTHLYDQQPSYFIIAGLCFTVLSRPYLVDTFGKSWVKRAPVDLIQLAYYGQLEFPDQQVVLLSTILVDDVNTGYGPSFHDTQLVALNGVKIRNIRHLVERVEAERKAGAPFLRFDFTLCRLVVLETELAFNSTRRILRQHCIEHDRSADLRESNGDASAVDGAEEKHADAQDWPSNNGAQQQEMEEEEEAHEAAQESDEADERQPPAGAGSAI